MVAELVDPDALAAAVRAHGSLRQSPDGGERGVAAQHGQAHVPLAGDRPDDSGYRVLLGNDHDLSVLIVPERAPVGFGRIFQRLIRGIPGDRPLCLHTGNSST